MVYKTPDSIENDPDVWFRAAYYENAVESALVAHGGIAVEDGISMQATHDGMDIMQVLPGSGVKVNIHAGPEEIRGTVFKPGESVSDRFLSGETVIAKLIQFAHIVDVQFISSRPAGIA
ncbi:hypothetical protein BH10PAT3_BH10PAT3_7850 [soil metagenome]